MAACSGWEKLDVVGGTFGRFSPTNFEERFATSGLYGLLEKPFAIASLTMKFHHQITEFHGELTVRLNRSEWASSKEV